ncbi:MAG TPA: hypothetical protein VIU41_13970 [Geobacteraceae bacterium]
MHSEVGRILIKAGFITQDQLEEALKNQVIFGGRLGTNLIELGYLDEAQLTKCLSMKFGIPAATTQQLNSIPADVLAIIPADQAQQHRTIPLSIDRKRLTVAMTDPTDLASIDQLSFRTGLIINPVVISELQLINALERYYRIKRQTRYINVGKELRTLASQNRQKASELTKLVEPKPATPTAPVAMPELIEIPEDFDGFLHHGLPETEVRDDRSTPIAAVPGQPTLATLCDSLAEAKTREMIGDALMDYLRSAFPRAALFLVKEPQVTGWLAAADGVPNNSVGEFRCVVSAPSLFAQVMETKSFRMGPFTESTDKKIGDLLAIRQMTSLVIPVVLTNRVVMLICVAAPLETLTRALAELQKIAIKTTMAFEILILRNKVLTP